MAEKQRKKLAIIDGKSVFYRGYYAMPNLTTKDGTPTGGVYGFCAMSLELIKRLKPDYVCVAWDKPKTNIRQRLKVFPDYKAGRKPPPEDFYAQIPILHEVLETLNWPLYEFDDFEADDIMHTMALKAHKEGLETMLITSDLDALQSIDEHTHLYALKKGLTNIERFDPKAFEAKYGIKVDQFLDSKALKGDSSDNIPGVPGIGEKGASVLLNEYGTLDEIYDNLALIKHTMAKKLEAGKELAYMSKEVARLYDDAPVGLDLEQMDITKLDVNALAAILKRLEFRSLLRNLPEGMKADQEDNIAPAESIRTLKLPDVMQIKKASDLSKISLEGDVVLHARSAQKHGKKPTVILVADKQTCYAIDLRHISAKSLPQSPVSNLQSVTGHDVKNSIKVLMELGLNIPVVSHDTLVGAFIVNSTRRDQSLTDQASSDLGYETELDDLDDDELLTRAGEITAVIHELAELQGEQMSEVTSLIKLAEEVEWPVIPVLAEMERAGMKLDIKFFSDLSADLGDRISDVEQTIYGYADQEFNIASPGQLSEILFDTLKLPTNGVKKGKTGNYSTAVGVLEKLKDQHPIIKHIEEFREYSKLKSTYVDPLPKMVDENDRVHGTLNLTVASTGRLSSMDPNLQNIPVRTELGRQIRKGFIAEEGNVIISADYSQFELRIAAAMSGDEPMIKAFNEDRDIHTETAALIQGVEASEVTKEMRYAAKAVNFGILYGQGVHGLSEGAGISYAEAKEFIDKYFEVRPSLKAMIDRFKADAKDKGYVETIMGRRRPTPDVQSSNFMVREGAYRAAINMPIQGGAADLTKMAMIKVQEYFDQAYPQSSISNPQSSGTPFQIMQVHDSIMVECPEGQAEAVGEKMREIMESIKPDLGVNLKVDVDSGANWGEI
ncbi:MAG: DNA polymerase-1 [Candidatus Saccharimonadales bacterium]|jgi:DNA polymerase-1